MIEYVGCGAAREMLEPFVDGELGVNDQVALEAHLRWCNTCRARVEDMQLMAVAIRLRASAQGPDAAELPRALALIQSDVLTRIRAEHDLSLPVRLRQAFEDARFMWPALGATAALLVCLFSSTIVYRAARAGDPESMANMIQSMASAAAERRPMPLRLERLSSYFPVQLDDSILAPRTLDVGSTLETVRREDAVFTVSAVVTREGRVTNYELLPSGRWRGRRSATWATDVDAVLDSVKHTRFEPAQGADGGAVTVRMVWVLARTTVKAQADETSKPISDALARPPAPRPARS
jgi:hypothetical protein